MAQPSRTLEGWYVLHDVRSIDWAAWERTPPPRRSQIVQEAAAILADAVAVKDAAEGSSAVYALVGHKGDLLILHLRPTMEDLLLLDAKLSSAGFGTVTRRAYSFLSVTELGQYTAEDPARPPDPRREAFIARRLKPKVPDARYVSFYPMNKRRGELKNWYTLELDERRDLMYGHGAVGRAYRGRVQQMISGSMGFDDWEWGVTLFATDPLPIKKIVQEMRFDEASAVYGEFGPFYFGVRIDPGGLDGLFEGRPPLCEPGGLDDGE